MNIHDHTLSNWGQPSFPGFPSPIFVLFLTSLALATTPWVSQRLDTHPTNPQNIYHTVWAHVTWHQSNAEAKGAAQPLSYCKV
jgi:hypothetical protein